ncbi:hypothetical protein FHS92_003469 [Sphingobium subterraneum]|uniref:Uncharacterized protein n=1 Tax=Sphingobium subterraneum TaxID=627688 RepID=A0A841JB36_9SPHN|nr:hypothetical protein [Sphingobium subterraneum]
MEGVDAQLGVAAFLLGGDRIGKPVVPEQLKLDLGRTSGAPKEAGYLAEEQFPGRPAQVLQAAPQQGEAGTSPEQFVGSGAAATLPPAPLLSGRNEASDEAQPSPDERASGRENQPASSDPKAIPAARSQEGSSPQERAERDLLEGGVESGAQDFYEPDL